MENNIDNNIMQYKWNYWNETTTKSTVTSVLV